MIKLKLYVLTIFQQPGSVLCKISYQGSAWMNNDIWTIIYGNS